MRASSPHHVIDRAADITLKSLPRSSRHGTVIGADAARDAALVRADRAIDGHIFDFADGHPRWVIR